MTKPLAPNEMLEQDAQLLARAARRLAEAQGDLGVWAEHYRQDVQALLEIAYPRPRKGSLGAEVVPLSMEDRRQAPCWNHRRQEIGSHLAAYEIRRRWGVGSRAAYVRTWWRWVCRSCAEAFAEQHGVSMPPKGERGET